jgi:hypothetical protein
MPKVSIYLDGPTEAKARLAARSKGLSLSKWIGARIRDGIRGDWPQSFRELAGTWRCLPSIEKAHKRSSRDTKRLKF